MRRLPAVLILVAGACHHKKPAPPTQAGVNPSTNVTPPATPAPAFAELAGGVRRFAPPFAEETLALDAGPSLLAFVTPRRAYFFGADLKPLPAVELPGAAGNDPLVTVIGPERVAVVSTTPEATPHARVWFLDATGKQKPITAEVAGKPAFAAAMAGGRLALVLSSPPSILIYDGADGQVVGQKELPPDPAKISVTPDGNRAVVACRGSQTGAYGGVVLIDVSAHPTTFTTIGLGQGTPSPQAAAIVGDEVLVGAQDGSTPVAIAATRAGQFEKRVPLGTAGQVVGLVPAGNAVAVFLHVGAAPSITRRTYVLDAGTWASRSVVADAPALPANRAVVDGSRVLVPVCHAVDAIDLAAGSATQLREFPSPGDGPCLDGLVRIGDDLAARDGRQVVTFPAR